MNFQKIAQFSEGINVKEYSSRGKYVFENVTYGADYSAEVIDSKCNPLGLLDFAGNTKINRENFSNAVMVRTVWAG